MHRHYFRFLIGLLLLLAGSVFATPTITSVTPPSGPSTGGTSITLRGSGFNGTTAVSFGATPAATFSVITDSELMVVSPAHVPQVVSLEVTSGGQASIYYVYQGNWQVYVVNGDSGTVSVIDPVTDEVLPGPISVGENPCYITFRPDGTLAFVSNETSNTITRIDPTTNTTLTGISSQGTFPNAMAVNADGTVLYIANNNNGVIAALNTTTGGSIWTYSTGGNPSTLALSPDGTLLGVTDTATNKVTFLNTSSGLVNNSATVGVAQDCIVLNPVNSTAYITDNTSGTVSTVSPFTSSSASSISVGNNPTALAITPDGSTVYVVNASDDTVSVISTPSNTVSNTLSVGVFPKSILVTPDGTKAYIANNTSGTVSVINNLAVSTITTGIGSNPYALAALPDSSKIYVSNTGSDSVSVITKSNDAVVHTPSVGLFPCAIAVTPDQAPLALFTCQPAPAGQATPFDASASLSPVGTIARYAWNFGDGSTAVTTSPTISHVYPFGGDFSVTLTVTNSAGTSTQQIYSHASNRNFNLASLAITQNEIITHNGGPTAAASQNINIESNALPPTNLQGRQTKNRFVTQTDIINVLTWQAPQGGEAPSFYRIYRNSALTDLAGVVSANQPLKFLDHNRKPKCVYSYYVVTVSQSGSVSNPAVVTVTGN